MSRTVSADPREPSTVEKRTNTGVSMASAKNPALVIPVAAPLEANCLADGDLGEEPDPWAPP